MAGSELDDGQATRRGRVRRGRRLDRHGQLRPGVAGFGYYRGLSSVGTPLGDTVLHVSSHFS